MGKISLHATPIPCALNGFCCGSSTIFWAQPMQISHGVVLSERNLYHEPPRAGRSPPWTAMSFLVGVDTTMLAPMVVKGVVAAVALSQPVYCSVALFAMLPSGGRGVQPAGAVVAPCNVPHDGLLGCRDRVPCAVHDTLFDPWLSVLRAVKMVNRQCEVAVTKRMFTGLAMWLIEMDPLTGDPMDPWADYNKGVITVEFLEAMHKAGWVLKETVSVFQTAMFNPPGGSPVNYVDRVIPLPM